ncbi:copper chaperone PCu(A)C [Streptomyces lunaelactis]|uniref:copper chaperone PCu(A)C n=1 Tax=Streptomyces lunaelactis TaxID=1535768 RepID=UPI0015859A72|nr:copper chaperone PCu(A)C [Streptomyces lunaelactis]NUL06018.1 copper chaperone PCu(A)C [Streptomyces lunaelactis]
MTDSAHGSAGIRRSVTALARAALAPVAASALALGGLTAWTAVGAAGSPPRLDVIAARVLLPFNGNEVTAAVFRIRNTGDADDELTGVTSPVMGSAMLTGDSPAREGAARMRMVDAATVPGRGELAMSPYGLDVMVEVREPLREGQEIPFVLHFRDSERIRTMAVVVRPGDWTS